MGPDSAYNTPLTHPVSTVDIRLGKVLRLACNTGENSSLAKIHISANRFFPFHARHRLGHSL